MNQGGKRRADRRSLTSAILFGLGSEMGEVKSGCRLAAVAADDPSTKGRGSTASNAAMAARLTCDDHRRAVSEQSLIGGDAHLGALDLTAGGLTLQLPGELADLRDGLSRNGLAEAGQPTRCVDRDAAADRRCATAQ